MASKVRYGRPLGSTVSLTEDTIYQLNRDTVGVTDVWLEESDATNWTNLDNAPVETVLIPLTNLHTRIQNSTTDNPKVITIHYNSTLKASQIGFGCTGGGDFSNIKVVLLGSGGVSRTVIDDSADSTKLISKVYRFPEQLFNAIRIEFHTTDTVTVSNIVVPKEIGVSISQRELTTDSLKIMNYSHAELHEGNHYAYVEYHQILKNTTLDHLIITPDTTRWAHMTIGIDISTSSAVVEIWEDVTYSTTGTLQNSRNRNRNHPDDNTTEVYEGPTGVSTASAQLIRTYYLGSGKNTIGGGVRDNEEILLKQNAVYLVRITEQNLDNLYANLVFDWYEHTNLNTL